MKYTAPSFTVPTGHRDPSSCSHGWLDTNGRCVFCGADTSVIEQQRASLAASWARILDDREYELKTVWGAAAGAHIGRTVFGYGPLIDK